MSRFIMCSTFAVTVALGCSEPVSPSRSLEAARDRWSERGPASYSVRMLVRRFCECDLAVSGWVVVTVTNGAVESRHIEATGAAVPEHQIRFYPPVDSLFEVIADLRGRGYEKVAATYDPHYGYPAEISVDHMLRVIDDLNFTYSVRDLLIR